MLKVKRIISKSPEITKKIGRTLGKQIAISDLGLKNALIMAVTGELGAGKTVFAKGFAAGLGIKNLIKSPTFVVIHPYRLLRGIFKKFYHVDAYRLKNGKELVRIKFKEVFENPHNLILIEWSERIREILPSKRVNIHIDHVDQNTRKISIESKGLALEFKFSKF